MQVNRAAFTDKVVRMDADRPRAREPVKLRRILAVLHAKRARRRERVRRLRVTVHGYNVRGSRPRYHETVSAADTETRPAQHRARINVRAGIHNPRKGYPI